VRDTLLRDTEALEALKARLELSEIEGASCLVVVLVIWMGEAMTIIESLSI
jgi:hypothetical protein